MTLQLFGHPFSSYTMKALIALYENETSFDFRMLGPDQPENTAELARRWPVARFPLLVDGGTTVFETSAIIEHLAAFHAGPVALIPADAKAAVPVRMLDRVFDNHVMSPMQTIVFDARRGEDLTVLKAYRARLLARPSFARCIDDARPYRPFFPLGAPDRD